VANLLCVTLVSSFVFHDQNTQTLSCFSCVLNLHACFIRVILLVSIVLGVNFVNFDG
jgi:hypothetical protein